MANQWFRMYSEFASDPKVQSMSEVLQRRYVMLLCMRCSNVLATLRNDELAYALVISEAELQETKDAFVAKGLVSDTWDIAGWDKRQYVSDSSTERSRKLREDRKRQCNVAATEMHRPQITDTDTDKERAKSLKDIPADKPQAKRKRSIKTSLPDGFTISDSVKDWASANGHHSIQQHFEYFVSAAQAKGYTYADWDAALKNAIRSNWAKVPDNSGPISPASSHQRPQQPNKRLQAIMGIERSIQRNESVDSQ